MPTIAEQVYVVAQFLCHWEINSPTNQTNFNFYFSDSHRRITAGGQEYTPLDRFVNISSTRNSIISDGDSVEIGITGLDRNHQNDLTLNFSLYSIRYSKMTVRRAFFGREGELLDIYNDDSTTALNPRIKFKGFVNTYSITDTVDPISGAASNSLILQCIDQKSYWKNKKNGRQTNDYDAPLNDRCFVNTRRFKDRPIEWGK